MNGIAAIRQRQLCLPISKKLMSGWYCDGMAKPGLRKNEEEFDSTRWFENSEFD